MDYLQKLPFILGVLSAILTAIISYNMEVSNNNIYARVAIALISFYLLGMVIRGLFMSIDSDIKSKKEQEQQSENEEVKSNAGNLPVKGVKPDEEDIKSKLDLAAGEDDEFLPLAVSHMMNDKQLKKNK